MKIFKVLLLSATLLSAVPAYAQMPAPAVSKDAAAQPSGVYKIDPRHTSITWKVMHMGVSNYTARFSKVDGELNFNAKAPAQSTVKIAIPAASVDTGLPDFDKEIAGEKFFNGDKYPDITFVSTSVIKTGANTGKITGNLTLNGITKPVTLDTVFRGGIVHPMNKGRDLGFAATTKIKRSDFNVNYGIPMVGDEVEIAIETEFLQDAAKTPATR